jgi:pimeloyl-ACP methyl ester carboxylesterase
MKKIVLFLLIWSTQIMAEPVQVEHEGRVLNGNLITAGPSDTIFLIVHGTWAHSGMEIIASLQTLLEASGKNSLAITMSLGLSDRHGFMPCEPPIVANHGDAPAEIKRWVEYLENDWKEIVVIGHSRGGNQVVLFNQAYPSDSVSRLVLIAPMNSIEEESAQEYQEKYGTSLADVLEHASNNQGKVITADFLNCENIEVAAESFLSYYSAKPIRNTPELLRSVDRPVLVIQGTEDHLAHAYKAQTSLFKDNTYVSDIWIEGADHFFRDLYADELIDVLQEWLE